VAQSNDSGLPPTRKKWIALGILAVVGGLARFTMEPGKIRLVVLVLIASFALRIVLANLGSRYHDKQG
jgi:hypothetical protein